MESKTNLKQLLFIANNIKAKVQDTKKGVNLVGVEDSYKLEEIRKGNLKTLRDMLSISSNIT